MTYFRTGSPYYHRRAAVSRSCSGWEGVVPAGYGRQALKDRLNGVRAVILGPRVRWAKPCASITALTPFNRGKARWGEVYWRDPQLWSQAARAISTG